MKIRAKFTGEDGSLGYWNGDEYYLEIKSHEDKKGIIITENDGKGRCIYDSIIAFLNNWDNIRKV